MTSKSKVRLSSSASVWNLLPYTYMHVLDKNDNLTKRVCGPTRYTCDDHERVCLPITPMLLVPPRCYAIVENPIDASSVAVLDGDENDSKKGGKQTIATIRHGAREIRFEGLYALYPGETLALAPRPLEVVPANVALRLRARCEFADGNKRRRAGEEFLFAGPAVLRPHVDVEVRDVVNAVVVEANQAVRLRALHDCVDAGGVARHAGEEWLHAKPGAMLPGVDEQVVGVVDAIVLSPRTAVHVRATQNIGDDGRRRRAGDEYLVRWDEARAYMPHVHEHIVGIVEALVLGASEYAVIDNPVVDGRVQLGASAIRDGPCALFVQPQETLVGNAKRVRTMLRSHEALLARATVALPELNRRCGDSWLETGPQSYRPPLGVDIVERRVAIVAIDALNLYIFYALPLVASSLLFVIAAWLMLKFL
jgi:major vault protein